jgi:hypothetical protein
MDVMFPCLYGKETCMTAAHLPAPSRPLRLALVTQLGVTMPLASWRDR